MHHCREHGYTLGDLCHVCGKKSAKVMVPDFSPHDPHGKERRAEKFKHRN